MNNKIWSEEANGHCTLTASYMISTNAGVIMLSDPLPDEMRVE